MCLKAKKKKKPRKKKKKKKKLGGKREEKRWPALLPKYSQEVAAKCFAEGRNGDRSGPGHGRIWSGRIGFRVDPICSLFLIFIFVFRG